MTTTDGRGYSYRVVKALQNGDGTQPIIQLGRLCVEKDIPVRELAQQFGISKQSVYQWFVGRFQPSSRYDAKIAELLALYSSK